MSKLLLASDHAGFNAKEEIKNYLSSQGIEFTDLGPETDDRCDYPDFASNLAKRISLGEEKNGILVCGSGIGVSISANRFFGVRAVLCRSKEDAKMSRLHNDSNVICFGERFSTSSEMKSYLDVWMNTSFEGGRHTSRVKKIDQKVQFFSDVLQKTMLFWVFSFTILGVFLARTNSEYFKSVLTVEDGFLEWSSVVFLLTAGFYSLRRAIKLKRKNKNLMALTAFGIFIVCIFGSGEEISWGQRLFNIESTGVFKELNTQGETNLHNLKLNGVSINKLIFGKILSLVILVYLLVLPFIRDKVSIVGNLIKRFGIPIATNLQIISCLSVFALCELTGHSKKGELFEFGSTCIFMLIFLFPRNREELN